MPKTSTNGDDYQTKDLLPYPTDIINLGSQSLKFNKLYALNFYGSGINVPSSQYYANINLGPLTISGGTPSKRNITVTVGPFDAGNHRIKFPTKGLYMIVLHVEADLGATESYLLYKLYKTPTNTYVGSDFYQQVGCSSFYSYDITKTITFLHNVTSIDEQLEIHIGTATISNPFYNDVTNVKFTEGSGVYRIQSYE